jgi:lipopolysaccharide/colanic/teichoic acid biosynthesis glycosyltransferase
MSANLGLSGIPEAASFSNSIQPHYQGTANDDLRASVHRTVRSIDQGLIRFSSPLSRWSRSTSKRMFDLASVLLTLPLAVPAFLIVGFTVRITSRGPVLFRQQRMGRHGGIFTILKFRTMPHRCSAPDRPAVTTSSNQRFTPVGPFLRRWKLDELPQLINVLLGDMSLVGPRPKLPKHQSAYLHCRPGLTGGATIVFAREEVALASVPSCHLETYYHSVVLPAKQQLDDEYMAKASFVSDLKLILRSVFRHWDEVALSDMPSLQPHLARFAAHTRMSLEWTSKAHSSRVSVHPQNVSVHAPSQVAKFPSREL